MRFPEFDGKYNKVKLKSISKNIMYGLGAKAVPYDNYHKYIRITDIDDNFQFSPKSLVSPDFCSDEYLLNTNDILFARTGNTTGKSYLYDEKDGNVYFAGFLIRFNITENNDASYIYNIFKSSRYNKWVKLMSMRSGQPGINMKEYSSFDLFIPEYKEQRKLGMFLNNIDKKITLLNNKIENLKLFKKGIIESSINTLRNDHPSIKLKKLVNKMYSGGTPRSTEPSYYGGNIKFLSISDITSSGKRLNNVTKSITEIGLKNSSAKIVKKGNLIYTMYATIAVPIITDVDVAIPQSVMALELNEKANIDFVYYQLESLTGLVRSNYTETGTQGNINSNIVKNLELVIPDIYTQNELVKNFNLLDNKIDKLEDQLQNLKLFIRTKLIYHFKPSKGVTLYE